MAEVLVFHHALGLTEGIEAFASELAVAGHDVITPDLFDGRVLTSIDEGVAHTDAIGFENIAAAGARHADHLSDQLVAEAHAELHEYDTAAHLVADVTSPDYDAAIAATVSTRILELLKRFR